ncbi:signal recognition particle protein Srp19 [Thermogladius calderae 1633]|uniref:Signal recognition particle 19 kDa protein n=1 Tax=Thermogladius calderae (strain DSM 22663 / VKM B-2946 / 1633) TaxID=1184251 RepID=I3TCJ9_THEC1|nr:signal recognition particle subunit SRP19/SEC65 family protein [Thermogladius calderae]AFK50487.1 signal recognition particle protein Srp19 [Thermogladius calderae 1633]
MSREYEKRKVVIYPHYIDCSSTRSEGRRVPKSLCVPNPTLEEIEKAARRLGFEVEVEADKKYPRMWRKAGRVVVNKVFSKTRLLKLISMELKKTRG